MTSDKRPPCISVIIPCYNAERYIGETLASVAQQEYPVLDVVVVDDHSTDQSKAVVEREFLWARVAESPGRGASAARNMGTSLAEGEYLQYLDADDLLAPGKLRRQCRLLEESGADVAYGDWQRLEPVNGGYRPAGIVEPSLSEPEIDLFTDVWSPPAAYLFRRSIVEQVGGWHADLPIIQDARFVLDCALHGGRFVRGEGLMALYRVHARGSLSTRDPQAFVRDCFQNALEVERWWRERSGLDSRRVEALLEAYGYVARSCVETDPRTFEAAYAALHALRPHYLPADPPHFRLTAAAVGYRRAERLGHLYRRLKSEGPISGLVPRRP